MSETNPFLPTRFEYDTSPLLWKSPHARELEKPNSYFIKGIRGSGKTSILKAINWRERLDNKVLAEQIEPSSKCIAIYFRLPDHMSQSIAAINWDAVTPDAPIKHLMAYSFFSHFIEAISLEAVFEAVIEMRSRGVLNYEISDEISITELIVSKYSELKAYLPPPRDYVFSDLQIAFDRMHHEMNRAATRGTVSSILDRLPSSEPGELVKFIITQIMPLISKDNDVHVKVCIDDCETLKQQQQIFLNSLVRSSRAPIFWVVSFVASNYETSNTVINNQKLSDADRKVIDLENVSETEFRRLCEAVSSLRFFYEARKRQTPVFEGNKPDELVKLSSVLGGYSINHLFDTLTKKGLGSKLSEFRQRAKNLQVAGEASLNVESLKAIGLHNAKVLPFYQTFLLERLYPGVKIEEFADKDMKELKAFSALLRRKQVGAYLNMCEYYGASQPLYAGHNVVLSMSDGCIRDFLELMGSIYDGFSHRRTPLLESFVNRSAPVGIRAQSRWITRSSTQKLDGIREGKDSVEILTSEVAKVVAGLGWLTKYLQSTPSTNRSIQTAERGIFVFDLSKLLKGQDHNVEEDSDYIQRVFRRAVLDGLLRIEHPFNRGNKASDKGNVQLGYRLHKRYAAHFSFSYRGAYEPVEVDVAELLWLFKNAEEADPKKWASRQLEKLPDLDFDQLELKFQ